MGLSQEEKICGASQCLQKPQKSGSLNTTFYVTYAGKKLFSEKQRFGIEELGREVLPAGIPVPISESLRSPSLHPKLYFNIL